MFTIDLRKGQGLPPKSRPILVGLAIVPFLIPLVGLLVMGVCWQQNKTLIRTQQNIIRENQQKLSGLDSQLKQFRKIDDQIRFCSQQLNDVEKVLKYRIQTTPILVELVGPLPEFLTISQLDMDRSDVRKKAADDEKSENAKSGLVVQRKLKMTVSGPANDTTDIAVKQYVQNLSQAPGFSKLVNNIRILSQNSQSINDKNYSFYEIECVMKEQI